MALKHFANSGSTIEYFAEELCASLNTFSGNKDYIIAGIGNEMNIVHNQTSTITLKSGQAIVCGRPVINTGDISFNLTSGTNYYLVLRVEPNQVSLTCVSEGNIKSDNINNNGNYHDLVLAKYTATSSGLSSFEDMRLVKNKVGFEYEVIEEL